MLVQETNRIRRCGWNDKRRATRSTSTGAIPEALGGIGNGRKGGQWHGRLAEHPLTVFSFTFAEDADATIFFLRTAFTISEVQKELPNCIVGGYQSN